jgi:hypothetical protein
MEYDLNHAAGLPILYPGDLGPFSWHQELLRRAGEADLPPPLSEETAKQIADKEVEYAHLAGQLKSYKARSLRRIAIPKKGISYLISENEATQRVLDLIADELHTWTSKHRLDPEFVMNPAEWGLGQMLAERRDLLVALRLAQSRPVESEKFIEGINRPFFVTVTELLISFIPIVGSVVAAYEAYTGEDLFGYELDHVDRAILGASVLLPFVGRFIKGGRALYTAERMAALYGRDAVQWSKVISASERLAARPGGIKLLRESADAVRSGKHLASDVERTKQLEALLKDLELDKLGVAKGVATAGVQDIARAEAIAKITAKYPVLLKGIKLDALALDRILAKGKNVDHIKGQLLEELLEVRVLELLGAQTGRRALGVEKVAGHLEFIPGYLIRDASGRQLTDGVLAIREAGSLRIVTIFEAKAGEAAVRELKLASSHLSELSVADRTELRRYSRDLLRELQEKAAVTGKPVTKTVEDIEREIILTERGGQVRRDIERLAPSLGETSTRIYVGGVETRAVVSPKASKFIGVLPRDVKSGNIKADVEQLGYAFDVLNVEAKSADLKSLAEDIAKLTARSTSQP